MACCTNNKGSYDIVLQVFQIHVLVLVSVAIKIQYYEVYVLILFISLLTGWQRNNYNIKGNLHYDK